MPKDMFMVPPQQMQTIESPSTTGAWGVMASAVQGIGTMVLGSGSIIGEAIKAASQTIIGVASVPATVVRAADESREKAVFVRSCTPVQTVTFIGGAQPRFQVTFYKPDYSVGDGEFEPEPPPQPDIENPPDVAPPVVQPEPDPE